MGIVTDGLVGYWHYQQGVSGSTWENIAPATKGQYNGTINGAVLQSDGMYFDGVDDMVLAQGVPMANSFTIEINGNVTQVGGGERGLVNLWRDANNRVWTGVNGTESNPSIRSIFGTILDGVFDNQTINSVATKNTNITVTFVFSKEKNEKATYVNTIEKGKVSYGGIGAGSVNLAIGANYYAPNHFGFFDGNIHSVKFYHKALSASEIAQNHAAGTDIGLEEEPPVSNPPAVTIVNINAPTADNTLSDEPNMDRATITFKFDQDVTEWRVRTVGTDPDTGILADSGGAVSAGTEITAEVDWTELYGEGQNRVNIYGKNANGQWTPYG